MSLAYGNGIPTITTDFVHQTELIDRTWRDRGRCTFWEMGTGKSRVTIETMVRQFLDGVIDRVLVVAPGGVHRNWITDELPRHCRVPWIGLDWHSDKSTTRDQQRSTVQLAAARSAMLWLALTYDGIKTVAGIEAARAFCKHGTRFALVVDEASRIKNPTAKRSKVVQGIAESSKLAAIRVLNGTPITNSPLDAYAQLRLIDPGFWRKRGISTWTAFQSEFSITKPIVLAATRREQDMPTVGREVDGREVGAAAAYEADGEIEIGEAPVHGRGRGGQLATGRTITVRVGFRNLDKLGAMIREASDRLTKEQANLDLPPKLYSRMGFELAPMQRRAYDKLRTEFMLELETGGLVTAAMAMTRILRLQQIACGYLPDPDDPDGDPIMFPGGGEEDPRMIAFLEIAESLPHQAIVWSRFRLDIDRITAALGKRAVRYDGKTSRSDRELALARFHAGDAQFFVANPAAISMGVTLTEAKSVVYYANSFSVLERLQSEDRCHRIGTHTAVNYYDLVAERTVDDKIRESLIRNQALASQVTGDELRTWLA